MPIEERKVTRYTPSCSECGWRGDSGFRRKHAERDLAKHPCGEHWEKSAHRMALGHFNRICICGASYLSETVSEDTFSCPRQREDAPTENLEEDE